MYYKGTRDGYDKIASMEQSKNSMDTIKTYAELFYDVVKDKKETSCNIMPHWYCVPVIMGNGGCVYFPLRTTCEIAGSTIVMIAFFVWRDAELASELLVHAIFQVGMTFFSIFFSLECI